MATDKFEAYYWDIYALIFESGDTLAFILRRGHGQQGAGNPRRFAFSRSFDFAQDSRLYAEILLAEDGEAIEERYAYIYYDAGGKRILQYDNRSHHPEIPTHPHHMRKGPIPAPGEKDRAWPTDIEFVTFEIVLKRIRERFFL